MDRGNRRVQYLIASAVSSSAVTVGVSFSWDTPVLPKIINNEIGFPMSDAAVSWMVSVGSIGFMTGSLIARFITDNYGRRISILSSALPISIATALMICASNAWMLCIARLLYGVGVGVTTAATIMYLAEITDKDIRGKISLGNRFMMSFGCLLVITVGAFVSYNTLNYLLIVCPVVYFSACWWIPESPFFLLKQGKVAAARKTLRLLKGIKDEDKLEELLSEMRAQVKTEMSRSSTFKEFIVGKRYRRATVIVLGVKLMQIMTGLHAIQHYIGSIVVESKSGVDVVTALIIFGACRFLLGICSALLVDRLGRRFLLIYSFLGASIFLAIVATYYGIYTSPTDSKYPYNLIPFVGIIISVAISMLGYESVSYMLPGELFPMNVKAIAMAMYNLFGGFINFLSVKSYQPIKDGTGFCGVFTSYSIAAMIGCIFCYFYVIETKGKTLKDIQIELQGDMYEDEKLNNIDVRNDSGLIEKCDNDIEVK